MVMENWVDRELNEAELFDRRLEARFKVLLDLLSQHSQASIPAACDARSEMIAAYRFFDNDKVTFESVLSPHIESSCKRTSKQKVALLVQDTTELDVTRPHSTMQGTGPLHNGNRNGALLHLLHAFTADGTPLGTLYAEAWTRDARDITQSLAKRGSSEKRRLCARKPFEEKESVRWLHTAQQCEALKEHCPKTQFVMLADRESDISQVIDYCTSQDSIDWIIRSEGSRVIHKEDKSAASVTTHDALANTKPLFTRTIDIRQRHSWGSQSVKHRPGKAERRERTVNVTVHAGKLTLNDPRPGRHNGIEVNAVLVRETKPNKQDEPLEWLLLTNLPIKGRQAVELIIEYYLQRWMIEIFFKVLKSGCKIESRRFEHIDRFLPALSLYLIVAWRSLYICRISRAAQNRPCTILYTAAEWQSCWMIVTKKTPPTTPPKLMEMTKIIAQLGGYVNRSGAGPPGPQTVWIGIQRMHDFATAWITFGPGATV